MNDIKMELEHLNQWVVVQASKATIRGGRLLTESWIQALEDESYLNVTLMERKALRC